MSTVGSSAVEQRAALVRWPDESDRRNALAANGSPCLLIVEPGAAVPPLAPNEDWVVRTSDERDVAARLDGLARRPLRPLRSAPVVLPSDLTAEQHRVAVQLVSPPDRFVSRQDLAFDDVADDELDGLIASLAVALAPLGFRLITVGPAGYLLERVGATSP